MEEFNNPLRLRRPLDHGVRVIVAHWRRPVKTSISIVNQRTKRNFLWFIRPFDG